MGMVGSKRASTDRGEEGASLIEFALILPILAALLLGIVTVVGFWLVGMQ